MLDFKKVLILAAHPDDEVLGVGGTIPLLKKDGAHITVVIATDGSSAQYANDRDAQKKRNDELRRANEILGTDALLHWDFPDMRLDTIEHLQLNSALEELLRNGKFDTVFVHHKGDLNKDHCCLHESLLVAARPQPGQFVKNIVSFPVNSSTEWGARSWTTQFCPNFYVDITDSLEKKLAALECYDGELRGFPHPRSTAAVKNRAAVYGSEVGYHYAEAFQLILARVS